MTQVDLLTHVRGEKPEGEHVAKRNLGHRAAPNKHHEADETELTCATHTHTHTHTHGWC
eukprot:COSAG03_NODE_569_length_6899_cov_3.150147_9_plen_59_part_00